MKGFFFFVIVKEETTRYRKAKRTTEEIGGGGEEYSKQKRDERGRNWTRPDSFAGKTRPQIQICANEGEKA